MTIKENLPRMVLTYESPYKLLFMFKSILWGCITFFISLSLGIATYFAFMREDANWTITVIFGLFSFLFLYSSIYSFKLHRSLEIDNLGKIVKYKESSMYKNITWQKNFQGFKLIKAFRPLMTVTSSGGRPARTWSIQLISNEGEIFEIGYNQFGAMNRKKAEELLNRIAVIMGIKQEIID